MQLECRSAWCGMWLSNVPEVFVVSTGIRRTQWSTICKASFIYSLTFGAFTVEGQVGQAVSIEQIRMTMYGTGNTRIVQ